MMAAHCHRQLTVTSLTSAALISDSEVPVVRVSAAGFTGNGKFSIVTVRVRVRLGVWQTQSRTVTVVLLRLGRS
jgi:hypothetical protein